MVIPDKSFKNFQAESAYVKAFMNIYELYCKKNDILSLLLKYAALKIISKKY